MWQFGRLVAFHVLCLAWMSVQSLPFGSQMLRVQMSIDKQPEQVHISFGADPTEMVVTWSTLDATSSDVVQYGVSTLDQTAKGTETKFVDGGSLHATQYIHRVRIQNLKPGQLYKYRCGSTDGWSDTFSFTTMQAGSNWSPRFAIFGDLGAVNAQSVPRLTDDVTKGMYDAILHVGDFAYDFDMANGQVGDTFMRKIEPIAANVPYMTCVGNHENAYNFSHYINRFTMTGGDGQNFFFSFDIGPVHVISFSTEFLFYTNFGTKQIFRQYAWLEADLQEANKPENRAKHPWIVTFGHRPMYCTNTDKDDCTTYESRTRKGIPGTMPGFEDLFFKYGVDLELWAHEHSYERLYPLYNKTMYNGSKEAPYTNPKAPVHITTGSAGCRERTDPFTKTPPPWSAFRSDDYGYSRMVVHNATHLYLEQVSDDKGGAVIDKIMLIKDKHGPYEI